ncbi:MAG: helix-hairpin-helix domain-containing protein [Bacteroidota bacterium]
MDSIKTNFSELLAAFSSEDSMTFLATFFFTWLIGFLVGYLWNRRKIRKIEEKLKKSEQEKIHFKTQWEGLQEQFALKEADLKKANLALAEKTTSLEASDAEKRTLNSRLNTALVDLDKSQEEFQEATSRMEDLNDQILGLRTKNSQMSLELEQKENQASQYGLSQQVDTSQYDNLMAENALLKNSIEELKANMGAEGTAEATVRISELESENESLKMQLAATPAAGGTGENAEVVEEYLAEIAQLESGNEVLNTSIQTLISENEELQANADQVAQYEAGHEVLQSTIAELIEKNEDLEQQLAVQGSNQVEWAMDDSVSVLLDDEAAEALDVEASKAKIRAAIGDQIARATVEERDDLQQINGVGPFIEEKLNDLGIYTYEQVSQLDEDMVQTLTSAIEFFPGRIDRDDWVGQADRLFYTKGNTPQEMSATSAKILTRRYATATEKIETSALAAVPRSTASVKPDDLKKIEGIGPKIAGILNESGIYTFANLSQTPVDRLKGILAAAGNRYKMHDPTSWPKQAALAAIGEWDELQQLQDALDGGRDVAKG